MRHGQWPPSQNIMPDPPQWMDCVDVERCELVENWNGDSACETESLSDCFFANSQWQHDPVGCTIDRWVECDAPTGSIGDQIDRSEDAENSRVQLSGTEKCAEW